MSRISRVRRATTIASTFAIALGIGFVMQNGDASAARYSAEKSPIVAKPVLVVDYSPLRPMTNFQLKPVPTIGSFPATVVPIDPDSIKLVAMVEDVAVKGGQLSLAGIQPTLAPTPDCDVRAVTVPDPNGAVDLTVISECRTNAVFTVNHGGMAFTSETDENGMSMQTVPAMSVEATFFITFEDGKSLATSTYVPMAERYNRVIFQWEGHPGEYLQETADMTSFGTIDRLGVDVGEIPRFAEVYSFPESIALAEGFDRIDVVATATERNCALDLFAESFTVFPGPSTGTFKDIRITLPGCDQVGDTIALKKILGETTLAAK